MASNDQAASSRPDRNGDNRRPTLFDNPFQVPPPIPIAIQPHNGNPPRTRWPMHNAVYDARMDILKKCLDQHHDINERNGVGNTCLHVACSLSFPGVVKYLCQMGADLNLRGSSNRTPLHVACLQGDMLSVRELVGFGCEVNHSSREGTPLHLALVQHRMDLARLLVMNGAAVNVMMNQRRMYPIHLICTEYSSIDFLDFMVENGADINQHGDRGLTPLIIATRSGKFHFTRYFLERGCSAHGRSHDGGNVFHAAVKSQSVEILRYLSNYVGSELYQFLSDGAAIRWTPLTMAIRIWEDEWLKSEVFQDHRPLLVMEELIKMGSDVDIGACAAAVLDASKFFYEEFIIKPYGLDVRWLNFIRLFLNASYNPGRMIRSLVTEVLPLMYGSLRGDDDDGDDEPPDGNLLPSRNCQRAFLRWLECVGGETMLLAHACRCVVRSVLRRHGDIRNLVDQIKVPTAFSEPRSLPLAIQGYICLSYIEM